MSRACYEKVSALFSSRFFFFFSLSLHYTAIPRDESSSGESVNAILGDHNVDKQMTDSLGEVGSTRIRFMCFLCLLNWIFFVQVAYLMADISHVDHDQIKDLYESLEGLSRTSL